MEILGTISKSNGNYLNNDVEVTFTLNNGKEYIVNMPHKDIELYIKNYLSEQEIIKIAKKYKKPNINRKCIIFAQLNPEE